MYDLSDLFMTFVTYFYTTNEVTLQDKQQWCLLTLRAWKLDFNILYLHDLDLWPMTLKVKLAEKYKTSGHQSKNLVATLGKSKYIWHTQCTSSTRMHVGFQHFLSSWPWPLTYDPWRTTSLKNTTKIDLSVKFQGHRSKMTRQLEYYQMPVHCCILVPQLSLSM